MNRKDILEALDQISDARIEKAATPPRKKTGNIYWYSAIAAMLAIAILLGIFLRPVSTTPGQIYDPTGRPTQPFTTSKKRTTFGASCEYAIHTPIPKHPVPKTR